MTKVKAYVEQLLLDSEAQYQSWVSKSARELADRFEVRSSRDVDESAVDHNSDQDHDKDFLA